MVVKINSAAPSGLNDVPLTVEVEDCRLVECQTQNYGTKRQSTRNDVESLQFLTGWVKTLIKLEIYLRVLLLTIAFGVILLKSLLWGKLPRQLFAYSSQRWGDDPCRISIAGLRG